MRFSLCSLVLLLSVLSFSSSYAQNARVQFIHNSPDTSLKYVDIYWNGTLLYNNFVFHRASPFINRPGGADAIVGIADSSSTSSGDAFATFNFTPEPSQAYLLILQGIQSEEGYSSYQPFDLKVVSGAREYGLDYATVDMMFVNGSPDTTVLDVNEAFLIQIPFAQNLGYGEHAPYLSMFTGDYVFRLANTENQTSLGDFNAPFTQYGQNGKAVTVLTSGFANPSLNSDGQLLSMWMAKSEGGMMIEYSSTQTSVVVVHNSADTSLQEVDVYWNGAKVIDDLAFRHSSLVIRKRHTSDLVQLAIAPAGSSSAQDAIYSKTIQPIANDTTLFLLNGLSNSLGYSVYQPMTLDEIPYPFQSVDNENEVAINFINGITDLSSYQLRKNDTEILLAQASFGQLQNFITDQNIQEWTMRNLESTFEIQSFSVPQELLQNQTLLVLGSGFFHPEQNNDGASFGLWAMAAPGNVLIEFGQEGFEYSNVRFFNNSSDEAVQEVDIYLNRELLAGAVAFEATDVIEVRANVEIELSIVPTGQALENAIYQQTHQLNHDDSYLMIIDGIVNSLTYNPAPEYGFRIFENPLSLSSGGSSQTDILFYHGATDVGTLNMHEVPFGTTVFNDQVFGNYSAGYLSIDASSDKNISVSNSVSGFVFGNYTIPLATNALGGEALLVFSRGFWNVSNNNNGNPFSLWMLKNDGTLEQLNAYVHISVDEFDEVGVALAYPNPAEGLLNLFVDGVRLSDGRKFEILDINGRVVSKGKINGSIDVANLSSGLYMLKAENLSIQFSKK